MGSAPVSYSFDYSRASTRIGGLGTRRPPLQISLPSAELQPKANELVKLQRGADMTASPVLLLPEADGVASHALLMAEVDVTASHILLPPKADCAPTSCSSLRLMARHPTSFSYLKQTAQN